MEYKQFEVVVVLLLLLLSFVVVVPISAHPLLLLDKWFAQIYLKFKFMVNPEVQSPLVYVIIQINNTLMVSISKFKIIHIGHYKL